MPTKHHVYSGIAAVIVIVTTVVAMLFVTGIAEITPSIGGTQGVIPGVPIMIAGRSSEQLNTHDELYQPPMPILTDSPNLSKKSWDPPSHSTPDLENERLSATEDVSHKVGDQSARRSPAPTSMPKDNLQGLP
jgi:hypothetical protein